MLSDIANVFRPFVKEVIKLGLVAYRTSSVVIQEAGEHLSDIVAEARSEMSDSSTPKDSPPEDSSPPKKKQRNP